MSLGSENGLSVADIAAVTDRNNGNYGGFGGGFGEMLIAMVMLFLFPMMFGGGMWGGGMFGGMGGWGNAGMMAAANGALTRADLCNEFNFNGLENAVRGVTQGLCDGFYAMQNSINGLGTTVMQGFSQAELSRSQQQAALMQQPSGMGRTSTGERTPRSFTLSTISVMLSSIRTLNGWSGKSLISAVGRSVT